MAAETGCSAAQQSGAVDWGRLTVGPLFALIGLVQLHGLLRQLATPGVVLGHAESVVSTALVLCFYLLTFHSYLRRGTPLSQQAGLAPRAAAIVATWLPLASGLLPATPTGAWIAAAADGLILAGVSWSLWSLRTLSRSFSIFPQARAVVRSGPYRFVRHPLYLGELTSFLGVVMTQPSSAHAVMWLALAGLQMYRTTREEQVLAATLPDYVVYRHTTPRRIVPGVF